MIIEKNKINFFLLIYVTRSAIPTTLFFNIFIDFFTTKKGVGVVGVSALVNILVNFIYIYSLSQFFISVKHFLYRILKKKKKSSMKTLLYFFKNLL